MTSFCLNVIAEDKIEKLVNHTMKTLSQHFEFKYTGAYLTAVNCGVSERCTKQTPSFLSPSFSTPPLPPVLMNQDGLKLETSATLPPWTRCHGIMLKR